MPLTITYYGLKPDSGGDGQYRGGLGLIREWRVDSPAGIFTANMDRFRFPPYGLAGGKPASLGRLMRIRDGQQTPIAPKSDAVRLLKGDIVRLETSGGGGFGDPSKRSAERRNADHTLGYVKG